MSAPRLRARGRLLRFKSNRTDRLETDLGLGESLSGEFKPYSLKADFHEKFLRIVLRYNRRYLRTSRHQPVILGLSIRRHCFLGQERRDPKPEFAGRGS